MNERDYSVDELELALLEHPQARMELEGGHCLTFHRAEGVYRAVLQPADGGSQEFGASDVPALLAQVRPVVEALQAEGEG